MRFVSLDPCEVFFLSAVFSLGPGSDFGFRYFFFCFTLFFAFSLLRSLSRAKPFSDTSQKCIDQEGLERRRTGLGNKCLTTLLTEPHVLQKQERSSRGSQSRLLGD